MLDRNLIDQEGITANPSLRLSSTGKEYSRLSDFQIAAHELVCWAKEIDKKDIVIAAMPELMLGDIDLIEEAIEALAKINVATDICRNARTRLCDRFLLSPGKRSLVVNPGLLLGHHQPTERITMNQPVFATNINSPGAAIGQAVGGSSVSHKIDNSISQLADPGVKDALYLVMKAIEKLDETQRREGEELLSIIAAQISEPINQRLPGAVLKGTMTEMKFLLSLSADVLQVLPTICRALGIASVI